MELFTQLRTTFYPPQPFASDIERLFLSDYSERHVIRRQVLTVIALTICLAYFAADAFNAFYNIQFRQVFSQIIFPLRLLGTLAMAFSTWLVFRPAIKNNEHYASFCGVCCALSTYLMLLALTYAVPFPDDYFYYYDGMQLVILYLFGLSRLLAKPTLTLLIILLLLSALTFNSYVIGMTAAQLAQIYQQEHATPMSFLCIFSLIGYLIALEYERAARNTFMRERELQQAREETQKNAEELLSLKEQSRLQAEQQNRDKSKFIAHAAHDLRNVMQPIENYLEVCAKALSRGDTQQAGQYLSAATIANKAMRSAVNGMLDISGLECGIINLQISNFDIRALAAEVMQENRTLAGQQQVELRLSKNRTKPAIVTSDRQHLKRILTNLVSNALKYAYPNQTDSAVVAIAIINQANSIRLDVIDNGIGIPLNEQENIFKPLYQLNNPERNRDKGVGLGLSIVETTLKLLTRHSLKLTSNPGRGARFSLNLPKGDGLTDDNPEQASAADCNLTGLYVLLVENDLLVKHSLFALLQSNGAEYEAASSIVELQNLLPTLQRYPDIVLTDYRLPDDCTAVEVISTVTAAFGYDLPTLIMTGETTDLSMTFLNRKILHKPVEAKRLLTEINQLARGHQQVPH